LYQAYQQQKHQKAIDQLERVLFFGVLPGIAAPDPTPADAIGHWPETDRIKFMRTQPACIQELYGLQPTEENPSGILPDSVCL
jgi:hypothetical protein